MFSVWKCDDLRYYNQVIFLNHYKLFQFALNGLNTFVISEIQEENLIGLSDQITEILFILSLSLSLFLSLSLSLDFFSDPQVAFLCRRFSKCGSLIFPPENDDPQQLLLSFTSGWLGEVLCGLICTDTRPVPCFPFAH